MKKYLLLLLLPSLLWAGTVTVKKTEKIQQPAGTIDRVSKRTANGKVFEFDHIGSGKFLSIISAEPVHYLDSTGVYQEFNFDSAPDTVNGFTVVRTGKFDVAYDSTGRIRWQKKDALLTLSPAFNRANVDIDFLIHSRGLKAEYILKNASAPSVLKWQITANDTVEDAGGGKGKGNLKKASRLMGQIAEFTAKDAVGKVVSLTASYKKDSLIVTLDTAGAVFPVTVDPSVIDSASQTAGGQLLGQPAAGTWYLSRDTINAQTVTAGFAVASPWLYDGTSGNDRTARTALVFPMNTLDIPTVVDSVRLWLRTDGSLPGEDTTYIYVAKGTFTGATPLVGWFNDFAGWTAGSAHTFTPLDSTHIAFLIADGAGWKSTLLTKAGRDTLKTHMGVDSLRLMLLEKRDVTRTVPGSAVDDGINMGGYAPYLSIYYQVNSPGISTTDDTLKAAVNLVGTIDSTGGGYITVRGFKYWPKGAGGSDTLTISTTGSYGAGTYTMYADSLLADTLYRYKAFVTYSQGNVYGAIDSFSSTINATATTIMVDGRAIGGIH